MQTIKRTRVTGGQADVYAVLRKYGPLPDHALVPLAQHVMPTHQSSSSIRSRRAELVRLGLVTEQPDRVVTGSGRKAKTFKAVR